MSFINEENKTFDIEVFFNQLDKDIREDYFSDELNEFIDGLEGDWNQEGIELLNIEPLVQEGGGEGGSEYCYLIFKYQEKYYQLDYSYYSYHGYEYNNYLAYEVKPMEVTVTKYKKV